jgi:EamA domain-containing membrane protein RarD
MFNETRLDMKINARAGTSLTFGLIGIVVTALVYLQISNSSHFDLAVQDNEYFLVLGFAALVVILSIINFAAGSAALRRTKEPHLRYAKLMAIAGIGLGVANIIPAGIMLVFMI